MPYIWLAGMIYFGMRDATTLVFGWIFAMLALHVAHMFLLSLLETVFEIYCIARKSLSGSPPQTLELVVNRMYGGK